MNSFCTKINKNEAHHFNTIFGKWYCNTTLLNYCYYYYIMLKQSKIYKYIVAGEMNIPLLLVSSVLYLVDRSMYLVDKSVNWMDWSLHLVNKSVYLPDCSVYLVVRSVYLEDRSLYLADRSDFLVTTSSLLLSNACIWDCSKSLSFSKIPFSANAWTSNVARKIKTAIVDI